MGRRLWILGAALLVVLGWLSWPAPERERAPASRRPTVASTEGPGSPGEASAAGRGGRGPAAAATRPPGAVDVVGVVEDLSGGPVEGAWVRVGESRGVTDGDGRFELWARPGTAKVAAGAPGYAAVDRDVHVPTSDLRLRLVPGALLAGHVRTGEGAPVAGAGGVEVGSAAGRGPPWSPSTPGRP